HGRAMCEGVVHARGDGVGRPVHELESALGALGVDVGDADHVHARGVAHLGEEHGAEAARSDETDLDRLAGVLAALEEVVQSHGGVRSDVEGWRVVQGAGQAPPRICSTQVATWSGSSSMSGEVFSTHCSRSSSSTKVMPSSSSVVRYSSRLVTVRSVYVCPTSSAASRMICWSSSEKPARVSPHMRKW